MRARRLAYPLALLAIAGLAALSVPRAQEPLAAAPVAEAASGSLSVWNTRSGEALLRADRLAPGDSTSGVVSIGNAGTVSGFFSLAQAGLDDRPGPNGGRLSDRLDLVVADVTKPGAPLVVYSGKLGDMTSQPLGQMAPGEVRTFRFTASLPEGQSAVGAGGDNAVAGSATVATFRWLAIGSGAATPAPADRRPPRLGLALPRGKRWVAERRMVVHARCNEACAFSARATLRAGRLTLRAPMRTRRLAAGRRTRLAIPLSPRWRREARLALAGKHHARLSFVATAHDAAGNRTRVSRRLKVGPGSRSAG